MRSHSRFEEQLAKAICRFHGSKFVRRDPDKGNMTFAATRGYTNDPDRFVERHWKEYDGSANVAAQHVAKTMVAAVQGWPLVGRWLARKLLRTVIEDRDLVEQMLANPYKP